MTMSSASPSPVFLNSRLGLHYFPDTLHYRDADLQTWLPELQELGAGWLVLRTEQDRAIPEHFLRGLKQASIEPLIQFPLSLQDLPDLKGIGTLLEVYARWGASYLVFYDRPNTREAWPVTGWVQQDLVERFLDRYLPVANLALQVGLTPVFPTLEPGGSYWDTAFLRSALQIMQRRKQEALLERLVLSADGGSASAQHSLDWGAGGPERWPLARPYQLPEGSQDQRGFRIFDWYLTIARSVLQAACSLILLKAGLPGDCSASAAEPADGTVEAQAQAQAETCTTIARLLAGEQVTDPLHAENILEPIPDPVIACNFWLLSAEPDSPQYCYAWFEGKERKRPVVDAMRAWKREWQAAQAKREQNAGNTSGGYVIGRSIRHYLLLPGSESGISDWYLEVIRPYVKKYHPTVGFSPEEAEKAARVTVVGNPQNYPDDLLSRLQKAGCYIEQISGDGTNIATELSVR
jgi:hypothetical protein